MGVEVRQPETLIVTKDAASGIQPLRRSTDPLSECRTSPWLTTMRGGADISTDTLYLAAPIYCHRCWLVSALYAGSLGWFSESEASHTRGGACCEFEVRPCHWAIFWDGGARLSAKSSSVRLICGVRWILSSSMIIRSCHELVAVWAQCAELS